MTKQDSEPKPVYEDSELLRVLSFTRFDVKKENGALEFTARRSDAWAIALQVSWFLSAVLVLLPLVQLFLQDQKLAFLVMILGVVLLGMTIIAISMTGASRYDAFRVPPYLKVQQRLWVKPMGEGPTVEVDGLRFGEGSPIDVMHSVHVNVVHAHGVTRVVEFHHVALVLKDTIIRIETFHNSEAAATYAEALRRVLGLPEMKIEILPERSIEHDRLVLFGGVLIMMLGLGIGGLFYWIAAEKLSVSLLVSLPVAGLLWVGVHWSIYWVFRSWVRRALRSLANDVSEVFRLLREKAGSPQ